MLNRTEKYMRVKPDTYYEELDFGDIKAEFNRIGEHFNEKLSKKNLVSELKILHRRRHLACWHDTSTISNASHLLVTFCCIYDPAIYYKDEEYFALTGKESKIIL